MPILRTTVDLTFLLLSVILIVTILKDTRERDVVNTARNEVLITKQELTNTMTRSMNYFEGRVNSAEQRQDSYQTSTSRRLDVLETRMIVLEAQRKDSGKNVNVNTNTNIVGK